jgi:hypothetical protein
MKKTQVTDMWTLGKYLVSACSDKEGELDRDQAKLVFMEFIARDEPIREEVLMLGFEHMIEATLQRERSRVLRGLPEWEDEDEGIVVHVKKGERCRNLNKERRMKVREFGPIGDLMLTVNGRSMPVKSMTKAQLLQVANLQITKGQTMRRRGNALKKLAGKVKDAKTKLKNAKELKKKDWDLAEAEYGD